MAKASEAENFYKGFLLGETGLRKLTDLLQTHCRKETLTESITYKLQRTDGSTLRTEDLAELLADENSRWQRITKLTLNCSGKKDEEFFGSLWVHVNFDRERGVRLDVEGDDILLVSSLFGNIKKYLQNSVTTATKISEGDFSVLVGIGSFLLLVGSLLASALLRDAPQSPSLDALLASGTLEEKLNYLLQRERSRQSLLSVALTPLLIGVPFLLGYIGGRCYPYLVIRNAFLIGQEAEEVNSRLETRNKILWGIIVALVVSVGGGIIVAYLTP
jgi:hypothetical protein